MVPLHWGLTQARRVIADSSCGRSSGSACSPRVYNKTMAKEKTTDIHLTALRNHSAHGRKIITFFVDQLAENTPISDLIETICSLVPGLRFSSQCVQNEMRYWFEYGVRDGSVTLGSEPTKEKAVEALLACLMRND